MRLPARPPKLLQSLLPQCFWNLPNRQNKIYLTFDDGPTPEVLPLILKTLDAYKIPATFFCVGENMQKHPDLVWEMQKRNHVIGNHTFNHISGWRTKNEAYFENIEACQKVYKSKLFRPPYGRLRASQANELRRKYKIIMWDVLSYDYDKKVLPEICFRNVIDATKSGSVIVFHDNVKALKNLEYALPRSIDFLLKKDFVFDVIK
ncbi:MAG TPA: polysaccharide deacetylase family protein [Bacteroidia bacterium]|nr:polysaccharide deacetylase family protein [Bacteroidia bacterium]